MPKKLPPLPGLALAIIIVLGLLVAAMALHISIIDGAEGAGPAQEIKRRGPFLIAYLTNPNDALPNPASVMRGTVKFRMEPASDTWTLQSWNDTDEDWDCAEAYFDTYAEATDSELGRVVTVAQVFSDAGLYLRGVVAADGSGACYADAELASKTRVMQLIVGNGMPGPTPPGYNPNPPTLENADALLYQAPGGDWVTQMLVSVGAAVAVMVVLRNATGLMMGIMVMPVSAFAMALIGYGSYWYVTVMALIFVLTVAAFTLLTRRPSG